METVLNSSYDELRQAAFELGFPLFGIVPAIQSPGFLKFCQWLDQGYAGSMDYLAKRRSAYRHPSSVLPEVRSLIMLGIPYQPATSLRRKRIRDSSNVSSESLRPRSSPSESLAGHASIHSPLPGFGRVASYATGSHDYHDVIHLRLKQLASKLIERYPDALVRGVVDTAPLLEREFAALAGLGWVGKNTLLLNQRTGSYFFLAALLTDTDIPYPTTLTTSDHCGNCTACIDACPTQAFPQPRILDATRCISYLTIEHRGAIPNEFRESIGDWVFGCDICQQVCPWNRMAKPTRETTFQPSPKFESVDLLTLLSLDDESFRRLYRKTPLWRTRRVGMQRNAMIVLGNQRTKEALPLLIQKLSSEDSTLRQTAAWAIGRMGVQESISVLEKCLTQESNQEVRNEIMEAMEFCRSHAGRELAKSTSSTT